MTRSTQLLTLLILSLFLYVEIAEAGLVRTSGRGTKSSNFSQDFLFVENSNINQVGITESAFVDLNTNSIFRGVGGGGRGLGAVPDDCINGYTQDEVDAIETDRNSAIDAFNNDPATAGLSDAEYDAALAAIEGSFEQQFNDLTVGDPCGYEFEQGEDLFAFGFFSLFFDTPAVEYEVNWTITGNGNSWRLPGEVNTGGDINTPEGLVESGWVTLNAIAPADLVPGDYSIFVDVSLSSNSGQFFWESNDPLNPVEIEFNPFCIDDPNDPTEFICGHRNVDPFSGNVVNPPTTFSSELEFLRILPASSSSPVPANAPSSVGIMILGLGALLNRRRQKR